MSIMIPSLQPGQRSVVFADAIPGVQGSRNCYRIFPSESAAERFAESFVNQYPRLECWIGNELGAQIRIVRKGR